jgi:periplasmic protein TonB
MMNPQDYLKADVLDIVFEGRNKAYGAYFLRKIYEKHVRNSLIIGGLAVVLGISAPLIYDKIKSQIDKANAMTVVEVNLKDIQLPEDLPPPPPPPPPKEPPPPPKATIKYVPPEVKPDAEVKEEAKVDPPPANVEVGSKTQDGTGQVAIQEAPQGQGEPAPPPPVVEEKPKEDEVFQVVEQQAEFPDGQAALFKWLSTNIKYPAVARENNIQGKVIVRFIVEKDGSINGVTVLRGANELLDKEATRVVKEMPKWKPGKQRGNAVRSYFTLPVVFKLEG